jgi:hypothetical protein
LCGEGWKPGNPESHEKAVTFIPPAASNFPRIFRTVDLLVGGYTGIVRVVPEYLSPQQYNPFDNRF